MKKEKLTESLHIGQRIIKTAAAVFLCFVIYLLRGKRGIPFYSAIAAILCMQPYVQNSGKTAWKRIFGTMVGAVYGLIILSIFVYGKIPEITLYILIALTVILVIKTAVLFHKSEAAYFSCVVFLSIVANHIMDEEPYIFVLNRVIDTFVGIFLSLLINNVRLPREHHKDILFISGLDDTLLNEQGSLTPYSVVELNRLIADGALFTVSTERTPASMLNELSNINLRLPLITMNGAALYDIENNRYEHAQYLSRQTVIKISQILQERHMEAFYNVIARDTLLIYYKDMNNPYMEKVYTGMRKNPLRNYIWSEHVDMDQVVYLYIIDEKDRILSLKEELMNHKDIQGMHIVSGIEKEYEGAAYLKIYDEHASRQMMHQYLADKLGAAQIVTYGSIPGMYDVFIENGDDNTVVRSMKSRYAPLKKFSLKTPVQNIAFHGKAK